MNPERVDQVPLEARDPFELRVNQASGVAESAVSAALRTGDMGFLHSFTTGSTVDRVFAWLRGRPVVSFVVCTATTLTRGT
jgi:pyruvate formate lyase activating enzyme